MIQAALLCIRSNDSSWSWDARVQRRKQSRIKDTLYEAVAWLYTGSICVPNQLGVAFQMFEMLAVIRNMKAPYADTERGFKKRILETELLIQQMGFLL